MCHLSHMSLLIYFSLLITQKNSEMLHKLGQNVELQLKMVTRWSKRYAKIILIISCDNIFVCFTILNFAKEHCRQNKHHKRLLLLMYSLFFSSRKSKHFGNIFRGSSKYVYLKQRKLRLYMK